MDKKIKSTFRMGIIAIVGIAAMFSCTDKWDDHYDGSVPISMTAYAGTTMQAIEEKAPDFAEIIKAVGYDRELSSENVYTIWAPVSFDKDSVLAVFAKNPDAVLEQFIKNHVARYSVSAIHDEEDKVISLMSVKKVSMVGDETFGTSKITQPNLSCSNGVLHVIDTNIQYQRNIYEMIKYFYDVAPDDISLYAFLHENDSNEIDENRSVSHGVDADGNKIWVAPFYIRRNEILDRIGTQIYSEDSDYIAIIPSTEAYKRRYEVAKGLLNLHPKQMDRDSLQNLYANKYAMRDLFYNRNSNKDGLSLGGNGLQYDSLKSTNFSFNAWPNNLYYSKKPLKGLPPDKDINDILAKSGTPIDCSNGVVFNAGEYPMSVTEQFFKKLVASASEKSIYRPETDPDKSYIATASDKSGTFRDYVVDTIWVDKENGEYERIDSTYIGERNYHFCDITFSSNNNPCVAFPISDILSGTYELYVVTYPIWAKNGFDGHSPKDEGGNKSYHFQVRIFEKSPDDKDKYASFVLMKPQVVVDGDYFITDYNNKIDTLYLGDYTFKYAYPKEDGITDTDGALIQFYNYVKNSDTDKYSREFLISSIILRPKFEATDEDDIIEAKRK